MLSLNWREQAITLTTPPVILLRGNNQERRGFFDEKGTVREKKFLTAPKKGNAL
jgi:hypothetical protein